MSKAEDKGKRGEGDGKRIEADQLRPGRVFRNCPDCPEMVVVPAGEFIMGSNEHDGEKPPHKVSIQRPFAASKYEVTFGEWDACVAGGGCASNPRPSEAGWGKGRRPVINVSWEDAKEYVAWVSRKAGTTYRLLSEAEWEYAARAGTTTNYAFGDTITNSQAQYSKRNTAEVGSFQPNNFGLHDMHGNVSEWCEDSWHPNYIGAPADASAWPSGDMHARVLRGGSWFHAPAGIRSAYRAKYLQDYRASDVGFRVARDL